MPIVGAEIGRNVRHQFFRHRHHPCRLTVGVFQQRYLPSVRAPVQFGVEHLVRKVLRDDIGHAVAPGKCLSRTACPLGTVGMDDVGYAVGCHIAGCHLFHGTHPTLHVAVLAERSATQLTVVDLDAVHLPFFHMSGCGHKLPPADSHAKLHARHDAHRVPLGSQGLALIQAEPSAVGRKERGNLKNMHDRCLLKLCSEKRSVHNHEGPKKRMTALEQQAHVILHISFYKCKRKVHFLHMSTKYSCTRVSSFSSGWKAVTS